MNSLTIVTYNDGISVMKAVQLLTWRVQNYDQ